LSEYIPKSLREAVEQRANRRCEYCRCLLSFTTESFAAEHIIPVARGGATIFANLALSCSGCNGRKYNKIEAHDPTTGEIVPLFHPRLHDWNEHFGWSEDYTLIVGKTPTGRATVKALGMNREGVVNLRWGMFLLGIHPPIDSP
jgi:hypothetical protein